MLQQPWFRNEIVYSKSLCINTIGVETGGGGIKGGLAPPPPYVFAKLYITLTIFCLPKFLMGLAPPPTLLSICFRRYWILLTVSIQTIDKLVTTLQGTLYMECQKVQYFIIV